MREQHGLSMANSNEDIPLEKFVRTDFGPIGRTVSTVREPNTSRQFHFWLADREDAEGLIEIGNIIVGVSQDQREVTFGTVTEMRSYSDVESFIADYLSHDFGKPNATIPTDVARVIVVTCAVMRNISGKTRPVSPSAVYFPTAHGIQLAFGLVDEHGESIYSGPPIPVGFFENGDDTHAAISVDQDFLIGPEGAHLNVSGISGLAAKTSSILFVSKSLLTHGSGRTAIVMFNVKGRDLLYVDHANPDLASDQSSIKIYDDLEIPAEPFIGTRFFAPGDGKSYKGTKSLRIDDVERFEWDLSMLKLDIPALFSSDDWDDRMEGAWYQITEELDRKSKTYSGMLRWLDESVIGPARQRNQIYARSVHIATWQKMYGHLSRFPYTFSGLIRPDGEGSDIPWQEIVPGGTFVIDIQMLNDRGQRLVFARSVRALSRLLESDKRLVDSIVVFVDELNKFAPAGNVRSPLKARLVDITARGRSSGLILFGAVQFASSVDREIVENSSTFLFGRTEANELRAPNYSGFSDEVKAKIMMLPQGQQLAKFAKFPQPIFIRFPLPPCVPGDHYHRMQSKSEAGPEPQ